MNYDSFEQFSTSPMFSKLVEIVVNRYKKSLASGDATSASDTQLALVSTVVSRVKRDSPTVGKLDDEDLYRHITDHFSDIFFDIDLNSVSETPVSSADRTSPVETPPKEERKPAKKLVATPVAIDEYLSQLEQDGYWITTFRGWPSQKDSTHIGWDDRRAYLKKSFTQKKKIEMLPGLLIAYKATKSDKGLIVEDLISPFAEFSRSNKDSIPVGVANCEYWHDKSPSGLAYDGNKPLEIDANTLVNLKVTYLNTCDAFEYFTLTINNREYTIANKFGMAIL